LVAQNDGGGSSTVTMTNGRRCLGCTNTICWRMKTRCWAMRAKRSFGLAAETVSDFETRFLDSKFKDSNTFKPNLSGDQTKIYLNTHFKDFSNLELLEINLNNKI
jgi:hypothetical protein